MALGSARGTRRPTGCSGRARGSRAPMLAAALLLATLLLAALSAGCSPAGSSDIGYSASQQEIVDALGEPAAFQIAYLPADDVDADGASSLRRAEVWYYPEHEQQISFIDGVAVSVQGWEWMPEVPADYPALSPAAFEISMSLDDVAGALGMAANDIEEIVIDPVLADEDDVHVYATEAAVFTIERGMLTYIQTIGAER
ncbi:MAG TPA: hypothetical protein VLQ52_06955 [Coriobacteriia bacterium]|nr:hypothetical protein [Coriobacteriia bacterium]